MAIANNTTVSGGPKDHSARIHRKHVPVTIKNLARWVDAVSELVERDPVYLPILRRLEDEYRLAQSLATRKIKRSAHKAAA